jgi:hypothetical protein
MNVSGISENGVLFNFNSSWDNPVPWRLVLTARHKRYIFAPLETCEVEETNNNAKWSIHPDWYDQKFKAGFYRQAKAFLELIDGVPTRDGLADVTGSMEIADNLYSLFIPRRVTPVVMNDKSSR